MTLTDTLVVGGILLFLFGRKKDPANMVAATTGADEKTTGAVRSSGDFNNAPFVPTGATPPYLPEYGGNNSEFIYSGTDPVLTTGAARLPGLQNQGNADSAGYTWMALNT